MNLVAVKLKAGAVGGAFTVSSSFSICLNKSSAGFGVGRDWYEQIPLAELDGLAKSDMKINNPIGPVQHDVVPCQGLPGIK